MGSKEPKNRVSFYLRRVREGEFVYATDRGSIVAQVTRTGPSSDPDEEALRQLASEGLVTRGSGKFARFRPVSLSKRVLEDRG